MNRLFGVLFCILIGIQANGQQSNGKSQGLNYQQSEPAIKIGHFEVAKKSAKNGVVEHVNVNYSISPMPMLSVLDLELSTPDPADFVVEIMDLNGKRILNWKTEKTYYRQNKQFDISEIKAGKYLIKVTMVGFPEQAYSIPFEKGMNLNQN